MLFSLALWTLPIGKANRTLQLALGLVQVHSCMHLHAARTAGRRMLVDPHRSFVSMTISSRRAHRLTTCDARPRHKHKQHCSDWTWARGQCMLHARLQGPPAVGLEHCSLTFSGGTTSFHFHNDFVLQHYNTVLLQVQVHVFAAIHQCSNQSLQLLHHTATLSADGSMASLHNTWQALVLQVISWYPHLVSLWPINACMIAAP